MALHVLLQAIKLGLPENDDLIEKSTTKLGSKLSLPTANKSKNEKGIFGGLNLEESE
jgi:hypothetical protein